MRAVSAEIFDVDRHWIPARKTDPGHYHYDLRFMIEADPKEPLVISSESKDLAWVDVARVTTRGWRCAGGDARVATTAGGHDSA